MYFFYISAVQVHVHMGVCAYMVAMLLPVLFCYGSVVLKLPLSWVVHDCIVILEDYLPGILHNPTQIKWHGFKLRTILAVSWKGLEQLQTSFGSVSLLSPMKIAGGHTQSS